MIASVPYCPLRSLSSVITKGTTPKTLGKAYVEKGIPFLRGEDVQGRAVDWASTGYFIDDETNALLRRSIIKPGDLLITIAGTVGRCGFVAPDSPPMNCNQAVAIIRLDATRVIPEYACFACQSPAVVASLAREGTTATITNLSLKQIGDISIPLPSLDEQRRIVDILNHAASIRRLRDDARSKVREIIPALFVEMFGDPATNPKGWPCKQVGDVISGADYGSSKKCSETDGSVPVLRMGNVAATGELLLDGLKYADFDDQEFEKLSLEQGDILFNRTNSKELVGKTGLWDGRFDAVAASYFIRVRVKRELVHPAFFWAFFNGPYMKRRLFETARGAIGQSNINAKELKAFPIPVPPVDLQQEFAERLADVNGMAALHDRATMAAEQMAQSLLSQVFDQTPSAGVAGTEAA